MGATLNYFMTGRHTGVTTLAKNLVEYSKKLTFFMSFHPKQRHLWYNQNDLSNSAAIKINEIVFDRLSKERISSFYEIYNLVESYGKRHATEMLQSMNLQLDNFYKFGGNIIVEGMPFVNGEHGKNILKNIETIVKYSKGHVNVYWFDAFEGLKFRYSGENGGYTEFMEGRHSMVTQMNNINLIEFIDDEENLIEFIKLTERFDETFDIKNLRYMKSVRHYNLYNDDMLMKYFRSNFLQYINYWSRTPLLSNIFETKNVTNIFKDSRTYVLNDDYHFMTFKDIFNDLVFDTKVYEKLKTFR
ncbi:gp22 [Sphingomonas phage PAU]|uniref:gp22 n=1 Tax=Sphingomonas phage PAU TaxID=1150991 RepID=UPI000257311B|nr:gp22 [Sphingomonas phage PAU]AFF28020.1 gp22 [Sphingomonas phage PAU]